MGRSFRLRLLTSLILPMFVLVPLFGLALIYLLEYQVFLPVLAKDVIAEGSTLAVELRDHPQAATNPAAAQAFLDQLSLPSPLQIDLLDSNGRLLATNQPEKRSPTGKLSPGIPVTADPPITSQWSITPNGPGHAAALDVIVPVIGTDNQVVGQLRLTRSLADLNQGLREARDWIIVALLVGVLTNTIVALVLSARITRPLSRITQAITTATLTAPPEGQPERIQEPGLTELDDLARAFNYLEERRYEIENTRKQMLANLVHELGRPLGSLQIAAHALLSGAESNAKLRIDLLRGMAERIELLGDLVNDLALAYLPERALNLHPLPFEPGPWLDSLIPLWIVMANHKGIQWQASWPEGLPVIEGDPARLEQALGNLVSNAIKFTPSGGKVSITAGADAEQVWITVADNGPGIATEDLQRLFNPFFRAEPTALKTPGLGLGLSIAKTIIEAHGGTIQVRSQPGKGSQFTLCIPYHE